jgi:hypothetical protein
MKVHKHYLHEPHIEVDYIDFLKNDSSYKILVDGQKFRLGLFNLTPLILSITRYGDVTCVERRGRYGNFGSKLLLKIPTTL